MLASSALCAAVIAAPAMAQQSGEAEIEEIVVVGSQIQGAKVTAALPVTMVNAEQIQAVAAGSGDELFRTIPQAGNVQFNSSFLPGSSNSARGDVNSISLRNLGTGNTLVLLNGRRTVVHPTTQAESLVPVFTYNTNAIPVAGLRRVEVLRDGAAAIYGSDAVAGVINTVLADDFDGAQFEVQYGGAEGTSMREGRFTGLVGKDFERGNITAFFSTEQRSALLDSDQEYTRYADKRPLFAGTEFETATSLDGRSASTPWGQFTARTTTAIRSNGVAVTGATGIFKIVPTANGCALSLSPGLCIASGALNVTTDRNLRQETAAVKTYTMPDVERYNFFGTAHYDLTDDIEFFSELGYYHAKTHGLQGPSNVATAASITVPATGYYNPFGAAVLPNGQVNPNRLPGLNIPAAGVPVTINTYSLVDVGATPVDVTNDQLRILGGLKGQKWGWNWESAALYSMAKVKDVSEAVSSTKLQQALSLSTPDAYNPFNGGDLGNVNYGDGTPSAAATLASLRVPIIRENRTELALWDFKVNKADLLAIWGGDIGAAMGVEVRHETYRDDRDQRIDGTLVYTDPVTGTVTGSDIPGTSTSPDVRGKRTVVSGFAELAVPLVSPEMNIPFVDRLELQLAGRAEHYDDVGSVAKPKIAGAWDIVPGLRIRSSYSEGFRAPNLEQINVTQVSRSNNRQDYIFCEADLRAGRITSFNACARSKATRAIRAGNPDLKPETSTSFSWGVVLEPQFIPEKFGRVTLTADVWKIKQQGIIGVFGEGNGVILDYYLRLQGSSNPKVHRAAPTPEEIQAFAGTGLTPVGEVISVDDQYVNQLPQVAQGVDVGVMYRLNTERLGDFSFNFDLARIDKLYTRPTAQIQELLNAREAGQINSGTIITGASDLVGQGGTPEWRWSGSLNWKYGAFSADWFASYVGEFYSTALTYAATGEFFNVPSTTLHNVGVAYQFEEGRFAGTRVRVGARNVFDKEPPLTPGGYAGTVYNPYARYLYVNVRKTF
ncbi:TonB-dependent receptor [Caulobacter segnis]|uniref:TonB-dependent receptor plug domain-containing protein n=1 Tax=Caulobacter segnis TaxID=88688 RepID=UPI00241042EB|nr:TonB-dependent receptor [Caulobacter segnis]MDG2522914.1 TonB-dependent receptor [Caulobacter segnis]